MNAIDDFKGCVLDRVVEGNAACSEGVLIGLHDENSTPLDLLPFLRLLASRKLVVAPRSARWSSFQSGGRFSWFSSVSPPLIEPIGFGDGLIQLEQLLFDSSRRSADQRVALMGKGQGATMAVALAVLWPELVGEVIVIRGAWPDVPGWTLPHRNLFGLRALIIDGCDPTGINLASLGADVTEHFSGSASDKELAASVAKWLEAVR